LPPITDKKIPSQFYKVTSVNSIRSNSAGNFHIQHRHVPSQSSSYRKIFYRPSMEKQSSISFIRPENSTSRLVKKLSKNETNTNWPQVVQGFAIKPHLK